MMGERRVQQDPLFYEFSLERHVPADHLLRSIERFVDLSGIRDHLRPFYSEMGRPSIDPELMIRMLIVGYCYGIRFERRLCEEVEMHLAYRWFCSGSLDILGQPPWPVPRQRHLAPCVRGRGADLYERWPGQGRRLCRRCECD